MSGLYLTTFKPPSSDHVASGMPSLSTMSAAEDGMSHILQLHPSTTCLVWYVSVLAILPRQTVSLHRSWFSNGRGKGVELTNSTKSMSSSARNLAINALHQCERCSLSRNSH